MRPRWTPRNSRGGGGRGWRGGGGSWRGGGGGNKRPRSVTPTPHPPLSDDSSPYYGWMEYFPEEVYCADTPLAARIRVFVRVFEDMLQDIDLSTEISVKGSLTLDVKSFVTQDAIGNEVPDQFSCIHSYPT